MNVAGQLDKDLNSFRSRKETEEANYRNAKNTEAKTREESGMKLKLQRVKAYREQLNLNVEKIEEKIKRKEDEQHGELKGEKEKKTTL